MADALICLTCGTQYPAADAAPERCAICSDARQYVHPAGQQWTTLTELRRTHRNSFKFEDAGLVGIGTEPAFAIGQRAVLVQTGGGNILWDCIPLLDETTIAIIRGLGGLSAIAISHPHFYSTMVEWSHAFGRVPIHIHAADRHWVMRPDQVIHYWDGEMRTLGDELTLVRCGGHFDGGTVLHWAAGADGHGALLTGDVLQVTQDREHVSFMYSYPNLVPVSPRTIERIVRALAPLRYESVHGAWWGRAISHGGKEAVARSAARYLKAIREDDEQRPPGVAAGDRPT